MTQEHFRLITDVLPEPMYLLSCDGMIRETNPSAAQFLGLPPGELVGRGLTEIVSDPPDDIAHYLRLCTRSKSPVLGAMVFIGANGGNDCRTEGVLLRPRSEATEGLVMLRVIPKQAAVSQFAGLNLRVEELGQEVQRRKMAEKLALDQEELLRVTLRSIGDGVITTDTESRIRNMNPVAEILTGWPADEASDKALAQVFQVVDETTRQPIDGLSPRAFREGTTAGPPNQILLIAKNGEEHPVDYSAAAIRSSDGQTLGSVVVFRDISERRAYERQQAAAHEQALRSLRAEERERRLLAEAADANAKFRAFFEQGALFAGIMRPDGTLVEANRLSLEACGYTREQVLGRPFWDGPWWTPSPTAVEQIKEACRHATAGETYRAEMPYYLADGTQRWVDFILLPVKDEAGQVMFLTPTGTDITDQKRTENQLAEALRFYHSSIDALSSHIAVINQRGVILAVNHAWRRFAEENQFVGARFGVGMNYIDVCDRSSLNSAQIGLVAQGIRDVLADRRPSFEMEYPCGSPTEDRWFLMQITRFKSPGEVLAVVSHENVTERRAAEEGLRNLALKLREVDRRKNNFLATLAHELRNPLAPLRNGLHLIRIAGENPKALEEARVMMDRQLNQMVRLVDDLIDVGRISNGKLELRRNPMHLRTAIDGAIEASRPLIDQMGHELTVTLPASTLVVDADLTRLSQVFQNLLNNAAKYSERGGRIAITVEARDGEAVVSIQDTGIGIAAEQLQEIFEMFSQVDGSLEKAQGGLGIGLCLARQLVEMHGGQVEAQSDGPHQGSVFTVRLPLASEDKGLSTGGDAHPAAEPSNLRILVVDDNKDSADSLAMMLELMGNNLRTAYDGAEAVKAASEFRPDVILLDIGLPTLTGYEACRLIRRQEGNEKVVIIAQTGWGQAEDYKRTKDAGFDYHLVKPVDPAPLSQLLLSLQAQRVRP